MDPGIPPIKAFPSDGRIWAVDWIGAAKLNPQVPSEPAIQLLLSIHPKSHSPQNQSNAGSKHRRTIEVGVGCLPYIHTGSIWKNGVRIGPPPCEQHTFHNLSFDSSTMKVVSSGFAFSRPDGDKYLIPPFEYQIGPGLATKCLVVSYGEDPYGLIIPAIEVIRFYYLQSTALTLAVFRRRLHDPTNDVYDPKGSGWIDKNAFRVTLRPGLRGEDARIAALLASSGYALKQAAAIGDSLTRSFRNTGTAVPEALPPFTGSAVLTARGKWISSDNRKRFLVYWIESGNLPCGFDMIECISDGGSQIARISTGAGRPEADARPARRRNTAGGRIRSDEEPTKRHPETVLGLDEKRFFNPVQIVHKRRRRRAVPVPSAGTEAEEIPADFSTGEGIHSGASFSVPIRFVHKDSAAKEPGARPASPKKPTMSPNLELFRRILEAISVLEPIRYSFVRVEGLATDPSDGPWNFFPLLTGEDGSPSWPYLDIKARIRRRVGVAAVVVQKKTFYLLETERRPTDYGIAMLEIHAPNGTPLTDEVLAELLLECARNKGTRLRDGQLPELKRKKFAHLSLNQGDFEKRLAAYLRKTADEINRTPVPEKPTSPKNSEKEGREE